MELELKQCVRCKMEKPTFAFHRSSKNSDGLQSYCKDCQKAAARQRRLHPKDSLECDPALADFDSGHLIDELRARVYHGQLSFAVTKVHKINL